MRALLATLPCLCLAAACGGDDDETCGPGDAAGGLAVGDLTFDDFRSSPNNDCTPMQGREPTSVTIQGDQSAPDGAGFLVLCLPRPDEIGGDPISLADTDRVQVVDLFGKDADDCTVRVDDASDASVTFTGFCADGTDDAGYALALEGTISVTRTCGVDDPVAEDLEVSGTTAVVATQI